MALQLTWHRHPKDRSTTFAEWHGFVLEAFDGGEWYVWTGSVDMKHELLVCHHEQVKGKDIEEARQRATAAALVYNSWLNNSTTHGRQATA